MALIYKLGVASDSSHSGATHTTFDIFAKYAVFDASGNQIRVNDNLGDSIDLDDIVNPGLYYGTLRETLPDGLVVGPFALSVTQYSQFLDTYSNLYHRRKLDSSATTTQ